jgi:hypothetical protein
MTEERPTDPTPATDDTTVTPPPPEAPGSAPSYTPPPIAPPVAPQPAVAWAPPPATVRATGSRTTLSLAAGVLLFVLGVLGALFALLILTIGREVVGQLDFTRYMRGIDTGGADVNAIASSAATFVGILLLVFSVFYIVGGVGIMRSANWGRVIGIIVGILAGLFWLSGIMNGGQGGGGGGFAVVLLAIHAYVAIALLFFWRYRSAS